jgi:hypothetical protein
MVFKIYRVGLGRKFLIGLGEYFEVSVRVFELHGYTNGETFDVETCRRTKRRWNLMLYFLYLCQLRICKKRAEELEAYQMSVMRVDRGIHFAASKNKGLLARLWLGNYSTTLLQLDIRFWARDNAQRSIKQRNVRLSALHDKHVTTVLIAAVCSGTFLLHSAGRIHFIFQTLHSQLCGT